MANKLLIFSFNDNDNRYHVNGIYGISMTKIIAKIGFSLLLFFLISLLGINACLASPLTTADHNMIQEQQKLILEEAQKQRESLKQSLNIQTETITPPSDHITLCFPINTIIFRGAEHLSTKEQTDLTKLYLDQCLSIEQIQFLVKNITNYYISKGFITSSAYVDEQDISTGILMISIIEGKIEAINLNGQSPFILKMVFPNLVGNVLNLRDIEQGLEQLNRLQSQKININILPSPKNGYSIIALDSERQKSLPVALSLGTNNSGQKSTGIGQSVIHFLVENPLHIADIWQFSTSTNNDFRHNHASRSFSGHLSVPYGYWTLDYLYSSNYFYYDIPLVFAKWHYKGKNQFQRIMVNRLLYRDSDTKLTFTSYFSRKNNENTIAGTKLAMSSPTLNMLSVGINYSTIFNQGYFTFNPVITRGLSIWDTPPDSNRLSGMPKNQFTKLVINSSYYKPLSDSTHYLTSLSAQWSEHNLYSTERISIGGEYSIRGFKENSLAGNQGLYWRNELTHRTHFNSAIKTVSLTGAIDSGWIKSKQNYIDGGNMTGISLGLALSDNNYYNTSISIGKPLFYPKIMNPDHWVSYFQLSLNF